MRLHDCGIDDNRPLSTRFERTMFFFLRFASGGFAFPYAPGG
jgi:hypothetical protein